MQLLASPYKDPREVPSEYKVYEQVFFFHIKQKVWNWHHSDISTCCFM